MALFHWLKFNTRAAKILYIYSVAFLLLSPSSLKRSLFLLYMIDGRSLVKTLIYLSLDSWTFAQIKKRRTRNMPVSYKRAE